MLDPSHDFKFPLEIKKEVAPSLFKATSPNSTSILLVKKIPVNNGIPLKLIREIKILKKINDQNVQNILELQLEPNYLNIVYPFYEVCLETLLTAPIEHDLFVSVIRQVFKGASAIHTVGGIHRSINPSNIMIADGRAVLCNFSNAREVYCGMTNSVVDLHYTPLEVLLGDVDYDEKFDSWSLGCLVLEMQGVYDIKMEDEVSQCRELLRVLGAPEAAYPFSDLYEASKYRKQGVYDMIIQNRFKLKPKVHELVRELLILDKGKRLSAKNALKLKIFDTNLRDSHEFR